MTNPQYKIVPIEATDEMIDALSDIAVIEHDEYSALGEEGARVKGFFSIKNSEKCVKAAIEAAPQYPDKVIVDKSELEKMVRSAFNCGYDNGLNGVAPTKKGEIFKASKSYRLLQSFIMEATNADI